LGEIAASLREASENQQHQWAAKHCSDPLELFLLRPVKEPLRFGFTANEQFIRRWFHALDAQ
jgi:hypothetical protein